MPRTDSLGGGGDRWQEREAEHVSEEEQHRASVTSGCMPLVLVLPVTAATSRSHRHRLGARAYSAVLLSRAPIVVFVVFVVVVTAGTAVDTVLLLLRSLLLLSLTLLLARAQSVIVVA